jgi:hypothetical protein
MGKPDKNIPLGRPGSRGENNNTMNLKKVGWGEGSGLLWLRIRDRWRAPVNMVMNLWVPQSAGNFLTG